MIIQWSCWTTFTIRSSHVVSIMPNDALATTGARASTGLTVIYSARIYSGAAQGDLLLSGVPDYFDRNKILSGYDLSHYQVPHCIRVFFYFVWFVFIHHNFQFYFKLCTYCNILDIYLS